MKQEVNEFIQPVMQWLSQKGIAYGIDILAALLILLLGAIAIRIFAAILRKAIEKAVKGDGELISRFCVSVAVKACWAVLFVIILGKLGVDVGPLIAGLGATGLVIGFAFKDSLESLASGLMIALNRPFKVGDYVIVAGNEGVIRHLDMMAVTLATGDNKKITVPNKSAWGGPIVNFSANETRRVDLTVGVAYGSDLAKAREVIVKALAGVKGVLADPAPMSEVVSFEDSEVAFTCRSWVKNADYWSVFFAGNRAVVKALEEAGFDIPYPQLVVHNA